jgi:glycosyltransferase involved in cell wall biosynthesis
MIEASLLDRQEVDAGAPILLHIFPGFGVGGAQVRFISVANRFGKHYRHRIIALDRSTAARERLAGGLDVVFPDIAIRRGATFGNLGPFRRALRALRPDVLVTHNWGSMDWAIANLTVGVRHIHIEDGFGPEERDRQLRRRVLTRRLVLRGSTVVLPSRTPERIAADIWRLPRRRLHYIPNGIDLTRFARPRERASRFAGDGPVIGTVTALRPEKALDRLLHAFRIVSASVPARLVIAGDGPERAGLVQLASHLGLADRVHFTGHLSDPAPLYAAFDIFALSSDTEQMPLSVIEAMAAGLPVAATDVGDVRLMLAPENGRFVGPKDAGGLAASLVALVADPALRARLGAQNRAKAARDYDQEAMFAAYAALFDGPAYQARSE